MGKNTEVTKPETTEKKNIFAEGFDEVKSHPVAAAIGAGLTGLVGLIGLGIKALCGRGGDDDDDTPTTPNAD